MIDVFLAHLFLLIGTLSAIGLLAWGVWFPVREVGV